MKFIIVSIFMLFINYLVTAAEIKTVVKIESCAAVRCRVYFNDGSTDLLLNPYLGQKIIKK